MVGAAVKWGLGRLILTENARRVSPDIAGSDTLGPRTVALEQTRCILPNGCLVRRRCCWLWTHHGAVAVAIEPTSPLVALKEQSACGEPLCVSWFEYDLFVGFGVLCVPLLWVGCFLMEGWWECAVLGVTALPLQDVCPEILLHPSVLLLGMLMCFCGDQ